MTQNIVQKGKDSFIMFVWEDGSILFRKRPISIKGIRYKGQRPLFAYGSKDISVETFKSLTMCVHPIRGEVRQFEPIVEEILMDYLDRLPPHLSTIKIRAEDLKRNFTG